MSETPPMQGTCDTRFSHVRDAFAANFERHGDVGAAVCVYIHGKPVVDLWGGYADHARSRPWKRDTIVNVASTSKGIVALCAHVLVDRGLLDLESPVARYWPEFSQAGKERIPVRWLLSHRAGLPAFRHKLSAQALYDWPALIGELERTEPWWEPGTCHGYHVYTYGHLVGEVIRRITGKTVGQFLQAEITAPLGADFYIGVPESEDHRVAEVLPPPPAPPGETTLWQMLRRDPSSLGHRAFFNPPRPPGDTNTRAWRAAEIPAANGHTTARGLARIYAALAQRGELDGVQLLSPSVIDAAITEQSFGLDAVLPFITRFGQGFMLTLPGQPSHPNGGLQRFGPNPRAFGHPGAGGSVGFADPDADVGFGYVMNQFQWDTERHPDWRAANLVDAVYASLKAK
jgi:CubicO group peptidase (beta-lactamase class C family)